MADNEIDRLDDADVRALLAQFADAHDHAEDAFDDSVRTLAAAGVALTVSIASALHALPDVGMAAVAAFLASLTATVVSHQFTRRDMRLRRANILAGRHDELDRTRWTRMTEWANNVAGLTLVSGGGLLLAFVAEHFK